MLQLRSELVDPMLKPESIRQMSIVLKQKEVGNSKFDCLSALTPTGIHFGSTSCLDTGKPILRITVPQQGVPIVHNSVEKFQDHYIAQDLQLVQESKTIFDAHLDSIELLGSIDEALFQPPADTTKKPIKITISGGVMVGNLINKVQPEYPPDAKQAGIQGRVILQAKIGRDGHVEDLQVISGPVELQQASIEAVRQWTYKPYFLNGEPVEVNTTINVIFTLGNSPIKN